MITGYSKSEKIDPWVSKSQGKGTKSEPRDTKSEPKGTQREPKGAKSEPAGAKSEPTGAKREPTGVKSEPKDPKIDQQIEDDGPGKLTCSKKGVPRVLATIHFGSLFHQKTMKKSMRNSMPKK